MKGQTQQVFIYIMVILVVGGVLLFGYKSINNLIHKSCDLDQATFQNALKIKLERNLGYGDKSTRPIKSPCEYETLCFIDSNVSNTDANIEEIINQINTTVSPAIAQEVKAGTGNNVFLLKGKDATVLYSLDYLIVPGTVSATKFVCIKSVGDNFYMSLEGVGKGKVKITATT